MLTPASFATNAASSGSISCGFLNQLSLAALFSTREFCVSLFFMSMSKKAYYAPAGEETHCADDQLWVPELSFAQLKHQLAKRSLLSVGTKATLAGRLQAVLETEAKARSAKRSKTALLVSPFLGARGLNFLTGSCLAHVASFLEWHEVPSVAQCCRNLRAFLSLALTGRPSPWCGLVSCR